MLIATSLRCRSVWGEAQGHPAGSLPALLLRGGSYFICFRACAANQNLSSRRIRVSALLMSQRRRRPLTPSCCPHGTRAP